MSQSKTDTETTSTYKGQSIQDMEEWIKENPGYIDGVLERYRMIREMKDNPYAHYYGYGKPID